MPVSYIPSAEQVVERQNTTARKRRRNQNVEIEELGELLPYKPVDGKSLDKLSILRLTTSYIKFQNFMTAAYGDDGKRNDSILTDLLDQAMDGFLLVLADDAMILYASDNMEKFVGLNPRDVIGHSLHDLVQSEDDSETIQENLQPKGTQLNQHRLFYIRLRNSVTPGRVKLSRYNTNMMLQVSGHLKVVLDHSLNITFSKLSPELAADPEAADEMVPRKPHTLGLIVECRPIESSPSILELNVPQTSFTSTVGMDMKIQSVDTKVKEVLGFDPSDFVGSTMGDYFHPLDCADMLPCRKMLQRTGYACSPVFRCMTSSGDWTWVQIEGTLRFNKETREPNHLDVVMKIVSQNEGTLKYIEQQEFYSNGKTEDCAALIHQDPYDTFFPQEPVPQTHESLVAGLKEANVPDSAIDTFLHSRELGLSQLPELICDVVSGEEEAVHLEAKNQALFQKLDVKKIQAEGNFNILYLTRLAKEMEKGGLSEGQGSPPSGNFTSSLSPPQSVSSAPSPASSSLSPPGSISSTASRPPVSISNYDSHIHSPRSVPVTVPSPQSVLSLVPNHNSAPPSVYSHNSAQMNSPDSILSLVPSPNSAPPSVYSHTSAPMNSPDSGIDSPTSAGSESIPNENGIGILEPLEPNTASSLIVPAQVPYAGIQVPFQQSTELPVPQFQNTSLAEGHIHRPPFTQSISNTYSFQPQSTNIPNSFHFGAQQQQMPQQQQQHQMSQQMLFTQQTSNDETLEMLLSNLTVPQQQQQQQFSQEPQEWMEKQQMLQLQIQQQQKLLQDLLFQQQNHQMQLPQQHGALSSLTPTPSPASSVPLVQNSPLLSLTPTPSPASSVASSPYPMQQYSPSSLGTSPLPSQSTNDNKNGLSYTTGDATSLSFVGSVDFLPHSMADTSPAVPDLQELWQQFQP